MVRASRSRHRLPAEALLAAVITLLLVLAAAPCAVARSRWPVRVGHAPLMLPCGSAGVTVPTDWYFPQRGHAATGLVWLQHGFFETKANMAGVAKAYAERAGAVVVVPTITSNPFAAGGCWLNGARMWRAVAATLTNPAELQASAEDAYGGAVWLPERFVLSGHSAGGNLALAAAGDLAVGGDVAELRGVVLLDGVDFAGAMRTGLQRLTGPDDRPVWQVASPPSSCNAGGSGTQAVLAARPGRFVGVELLRGTHVDALGTDAGLFAELACGFPRPENIRAARLISCQWVFDALTGAQIGILSGTPGQQISVAGATAVVLPAG
ncbi:MAG TPA: hypothetical protein VE127_10650 [Solirubrobacteraceae bacterium]|nr:hypothetical protein [Solirubrobacteraceae bacterium]